MESVDVAATARNVSAPIRPAAISRGRPSRRARRRSGRPRWVVRTAARCFIPIGNRALAAKPPVKSRLCSALGTGGPRGPKTPLGPGNGRLGSGRIRARPAAPPVGSTGHAYAGVSSGGPFKTGSSWSRILFGVGLPVRLAPFQDGIDDVDAVTCQRGDGGVVVLALGPLLPVVLLRPRVGVRRHERRLEHRVL